MLGLTALLMASPRAYLAMKIAGTAYLLFLAVQALRGTKDHTHWENKPPRRRSPFVAGLATNVLNPKIAVFHAAPLPSLAPPSLGAWGLAILALQGQESDDVTIHPALPNRRCLPQPTSPQRTCEDRPMIDVDLPEAEAVPELVRSFAACMASVTEASIADVPQPRADLPGAIAHWRGWLAGRGAGLVAIAKPGHFAWPGYWLAVLDETGSNRRATGGTAVLMFGTPSGVVLSPQDPALLGAAANDLPVGEGYVISALDPAFVASGSPLPQLRGRVEAIALAEQATAPMRTVSHAQALAGRGLDGDRYAAKAGTFTPANDPSRGYDLTLIEAEVLDDLTLPDDTGVSYAEARRNVVTSGVRLNALVGRRFRIGDVECVGQRLCEPCAHLERLTAKGVLRRLIHRGGLRADIVTDGQITTGAVIETID